MIISSGVLLYLAELQWWSYVAILTLGAVFAAQLLALKEGAANYNQVAGKIFQWSITYLSLVSVVLVVAQLVKA
jgi:protoheme IX farnesyltransferase